MIAKTLTTKYNLTQIDAARLLGISQPAISLYDRKMRGKAINLEQDPELTELIENLTDALARDDLAHKDFIQRFCEICKATRAKGLLCQMHKTFDPTISVEKCQLCTSINALKCI
jgi:predicted transcriptional regulator